MQIRIPFYRTFPAPQVNSYGRPVQYPPIPVGYGGIPKPKDDDFNGQKPSWLKEGF